MVRGSSTLSLMSTPSYAGHFQLASASEKPINLANRLGVDYAKEAARLPPPPCPIIDIHAHTNGAQAGKIYSRVADLFGVSRVYTMVSLANAKIVRETLGERVRFIAFPDFRADRPKAMRDGFLADIQRFHDQFGAKMIKLWNAPRMHDFFDAESGRDCVGFDSEWRFRHAALADKLGMMIMVHVADPDTWFRTKYANPIKYRLKPDHYRPLRQLIDRFPRPWLLAHMGGSPENLPFLSELLTSHQNVYLDTSATKWIVRELSRHPRGEVIEFFQRWRGRILFGSDIVSVDEHLAPKPEPAAHPMADLADSPEKAFDLYASRYWALRAMFETDYDAESPIADPDLAMVEPERFGPMDAPRLQGLGLPKDLLKVMYHDAAAAMLGQVGERP